MSYSWAEDLNRHFSKEDIPTVMWKDAHSIINHQRNAKQNHNEVSPHTVRMAIIKKKRNTMLVRMWKKGNPCILLIGTWTAAAAMENSRDVLHDPEILFPSIYPKKTKPLIWKDVFTIAKLWKQPVSITRWKDKEDVAYMYNWILFRHKKIMKSCHFWQHSRSMDGYRGYFAKWNVRERQILYDLTYTRNMKETSL